MNTGFGALSNVKISPEGAIAVKTYGNTDFVNVMLEKQFYKQLEKTARRLEITPGKLIYNTMLLLMKNAVIDK